MDVKSILRSFTTDFDSETVMMMMNFISDVYLMAFLCRTLVPHFSYLAAKYLLLLSLGG
jgi:hypothetical protein